MGRGENTHSGNPENILYGDLLPASSVIHRLNPCGLSTDQHFFENVEGWSGARHWAVAAPTLPAEWKTRGTANLVRGDFFDFTDRANDPNTIWDDLYPADLQPHHEHPGMLAVRHRKSWGECFSLYNEDYLLAVSTLIDQPGGWFFSPKLVAVCYLPGNDPKAPTPVKGVVWECSFADATS